MKFSKAPGTKDILPEEAIIWEEVEKRIREVTKTYFYGEIITPAFESAGLFVHSVGDSTDIVTKEMYAFTDKGGREITLKPEGTASVARAYIENSFNLRPKPVKLFYIDRFHRYERPQKGRLREFHQFGAEVFGSLNPLVEVELIELSFKILKRLGFNDNEFSVDINTIGCRNCSPKYKEVLKEYFYNHKEKLCKDCINRIDKNVLRILDCKNENCINATEEAPTIFDYLCQDCKTHFEKLIESLIKFNINFKLNHRLVRGLDYYNRTVFEVISNSLGAQNAILGGGRYDYLVSDLGGPDTPACGFALGLERIIMLITEGNLLKIPQVNPFVYIVNTGGDTLFESFKLAKILRDENIVTDLDLDGKGIKRGLSNAEKRKAEKAIIIGEDELKNNTFILRDMASHTQEKYTIGEILEILKNKLKVKDL
jgi:histidyl-tRNA synthetase